MYLADTLSRAYLSLSPTNTPRSETEKEVQSIHAVDYLAISEQKFFKERLKTETHEIEPASPIQALWVNPFPSRFINKTIPWGGFARW